MNFQYSALPLNLQNISKKHSNYFRTHCPYKKRTESLHQSRYQSNDVNRLFRTSKKIHKWEKIYKEEELKLRASEQAKYKQSFVFKPLVWETKKEERPTRVVAPSTNHMSSLRQPNQGRNVERWKFDQPYEQFRVPRVQSMLPAYNAFALKGSPFRSNRDFVNSQSSNYAVFRSYEPSRPLSLNNGNDRMRSFNNFIRYNEEQIRAFRPEVNWHEYANYDQSNGVLEDEMNPYIESPVHHRNQEQIEYEEYPGEEFSFGCNKTDQNLSDHDEDDNFMILNQNVFWDKIANESDTATEELRESDSHDNVSNQYVTFSPPCPQIFFDSQDPFN